MLQYFLVLEKVDPWPHTVEGLCWLWLAVLSGSNALYFKGRDHWNVFLLPLHRIFRLDKVNLCSAVGDLNAEDRKNCLIGNISQVPMLFTTIKNFALLVFGSPISDLIVKNADLILLQTTTESVI